MTEKAFAETKAVVLLSGGLDSTTTLAIAKSEGYKIYALTFRYGQRHEVEIEAARRIAAHFNVDQHVVAHVTSPARSARATSDLSALCAPPSRLSPPTSFNVLPRSSVFQKIVGLLG